jgi:aconitate hydratase
MHTYPTDFLGVKAVVAKSFARIHGQNLCDFGILPLSFAGAGDYDLIAQGAHWNFPMSKTKSSVATP